MSAIEQYRQVEKEDLIATNPNRRWWQFWKPKWLPIKFTVNVMSGSVKKTKGKYKTVKLGKGKYVRH